MPTHQPWLPKPLLPLATSWATSSAPPFPILPPTPCSTTLFFVFICSRGSCKLHPGQHQAPWGAAAPMRSTQPQPSHPQPSPSCLLPSPQNHKLQLRHCWTALSFAASSPCCHPSNGSEAGGTHPARVQQPAGAPSGQNNISGGCWTSQQSQTLANAQSQAGISLATAASHSCAVLKASPLNPTKWPNPVSCAASGCWGTHQCHLQGLVRSPRHPRVNRWEGWGKTACWNTWRPC